MRYVASFLAAMTLFMTAQRCEAARFTAAFYDRLFTDSISPYAYIFEARDFMTDVRNRMDTVDSRVIGRALGKDARNSAESLIQKYNIYLATVSYAADTAEKGLLSEKEERRAKRSIELARTTYAKFVDVIKRFHGVISL